MPVSKKKPTTLTSEGSTQESSSPVLPEQEDFRQYLRRLGGHPKSCVKTQNGVLALYDQVRYGIEYTRGKLQRAQAW